MTNPADSVASRRPRWIGRCALLGLLAMAPPARAVTVPSGLPVTAELRAQMETASPGDVLAFELRVYDRLVVDDELEQVSGATLETRLPQVLEIFRRNADLAQNTPYAQDGVSLPSLRSALDLWVAAGGLAAYEQDGFRNSVSGRGTAGSIIALAGRADTREIDRPQTLEKESLAAVGGTMPSLLNLTLIGAPYVHDPTDPSTLGANAIIGIIDTGVDPNHPAIQGSLLTWPSGHPNAGSPVWLDRINGEAAPYDDHGRGTSLAAMMVGRDGGGVAPAARLSVCKATRALTPFSPNGGVLQSDDNELGTCLRFLVDPKCRGQLEAGCVPDPALAADVILIADWTSPPGVCVTNTRFLRAIETLKDAAILSVFAAGHDEPGGSYTPTSGVPGPANLAAALSVGAWDYTVGGVSIYPTTYRGYADCPVQLPFLTPSRRPAPQLIALGHAVRAAWPALPGPPVGPRYAELLDDGEGVAGAHVAAGAALLRSVNPILMPRQIEEILQQSAFGYVAGDHFPPLGTYNPGLLDMVSATQSESAAIVGTWIDGQPVPSGASSFPASPPYRRTGDKLDVRIRVRNTGVTTWRRETHRLVPLATQTWGVASVQFYGTGCDPVAAVGPDQEVEFRFLATAPATPNLSPGHAFRWQMANGGTKFGAATSALNVRIDGKDDAVFVSQKIGGLLVGDGDPISCDEAFSAELTFRNRGSKPWTFDAHGLYFVQNGNAVGTNQSPWSVFIPCPYPQIFCTPRWPTYDIPPLFTVPACPDDHSTGCDYTFNFVALCPTTPGVYEFKWQVARTPAQKIGTPSTPIKICSGSCENATISLLDLANSDYAPGSIVTVNVQGRNAGSTSWPIGYRPKVLESTWTNVVVTPVGGDTAVAAGAAKSYTVRFTVPAASAGRYPFTVQMSRANGTTFGGIANRSLGIQQTFRFSEGFSTTQGAAGWRYLYKEYGWQDMNLTSPVTCPPQVGNPCPYWNAWLDHPTAGRIWRGGLQADYRYKGGFPIALRWRAPKPNVRARIQGAIQALDDDSGIKFQVAVEEPGGTKRVLHPSGGGFSTLPRSFNQSFDVTTDLASGEQVAFVVKDRDEHTGVSNAAFDPVITLLPPPPSP